MSPYRLPDLRDQFSQELDEAYVAFVKAFGTLELVQHEMLTAMSAVRRIQNKPASLDTPGTAIELPRFIRPDWDEVAERVEAAIHDEFEPKKEAA